MARIVGTGGDDYVAPPAGEWYAPVPVLALSTEGADQIYTRGGNDYVEAGAGNDRVDLGAGNDIANGDDGDDWITGQAGDDTIWGDSPSIYFDGPGPHGNDQLYGGYGNDRLFGEGGDDRLSGGPGSDTLTDFEGSNRMFGGDGADFVLGAGTLLSGGAGNDYVGGYGRIEGGAGNDTLEAGWQSFSTLRGDAGADLFVVNSVVQDGVAQANAILDFRPGEGDKIDFRGFASAEIGAIPSRGAAMFAAFDTTRDGVIDGRDAYSTVASGQITLHNWEDTLTVSANHINAADWLMS